MKVLEFDRVQQAMDGCKDRGVYSEAMCTAMTYESTLGMVKLDYILGKYTKIEAIDWCNRLINELVYRLNNL